MSEKKFISTLLSAARESTTAVLAHVVDRFVFPWYEAVTGTHSASKTMRRQVADQVERNLTSTLWTATYLEDEEPFTKFVVGRVFPQSQVGSTYDLMVAVHPQGFPMNPIIVSLSDFIQDFVPDDNFSFYDFDA